jgi:hypothetical protein
MARLERATEAVEDEFEDTLVVVADIDSSEVYYQHTGHEFGHQLLARSALLASRQFGSALNE